MGVKVGDQKIWAEAAVRWYDIGEDHRLGLAGRGDNDEHLNTKLEGYGVLKK